MPELPEVETVVQSIASAVIGRTVKAISCTATHPRTLVHPDVLRTFRGATVSAVRRRGKFIIFELQPVGVIAIHLRMTGRISAVLPQNSRHVAGIIEFADQGENCWFSDVRKFGRIYGYRSLAELELDKRLGVEPLEAEFTPHILYELISKSKRQIKPFLLDQSNLVGLGNIYVDEALWLARIHPEIPANTLTPEQGDELYLSIQSVLRDAISRNGTSFQSFYFADGKKGDNQNFLAVFDRAGEPCGRCAQIITKMRVAGRGTHCCLTCQIKL